MLMFQCTMRNRNLEQYFDVLSKLLLAKILIMAFLHVEMMVNTYM